MSVHPLVTSILAESGMVERLLVEHVDDGSGHCKVCTIGSQAGRHTWPCTIHFYAAEARKHASRR